MTLFNPISESQFTVEFSGYGKFYFTEKDGGNIERSTSEYANGSGNTLYQIVGPQKISNVTLKAPYDLKYMSYLEPLIFAYSCGLTNTITVTPVSCNGEIISTTAAPANAANAFSIAGVTPLALGTPYIYTGARMLKYTMPKVDRKSANVSMFEIEFVVNSVARGVPYRAAQTNAGAPQTNAQAVNDFFGSNVA